MRVPAVIASTLLACAAHAAQAPSCLVLSRAVDRGAAIPADAIARAACPQAVASVVYDAHAHLIRASADFATGTAIRDVPSAYLAGATRGEPVLVVERSGGVTITRPAVLVSDASEGMSAVARTSDDSRIQGRLQP